MPFKVKKQPCTNSQGTAGTHVVYNANTGKKKSCHGSVSAAQAAARIANAASGDIKEDYTIGDLMKDATCIECDNGR